MSQAKQPRRLDAKSALCTLNMLRTSPRKLNLVAQQIRGKSAADALRILTFSPRRIAIDVKKALQSAIANAENNHALDVDRLSVTEASVGKSKQWTKFQARGRGKGERVTHDWSHLRVVVTEGAAPEKKTKPATKSNVKATAAAPKAAKPAAKKAAPKASQEAAETQTDQNQTDKA
jgi:large subunit ribosomal protein L22